MTGADLNQHDQDELLDQAVVAYFEAMEAGQTPDPDQWLARYPEVAAKLREFFADQLKVERWTRPLRPVAEAACLGAAWTPGPEGTLREAGDADSISQRSFGDYELLGLLGQGGMSVVYKARHKSLKRTVALKMIRADRLATAAEVRRFRAEAELVALLDHPHIVPIHEVGEHDGRLFLSLKLVSGGSLADRGAGFQPATLSEGRLETGTTPRAAACLVADVARAVHHAHQRGVLHRDLKPSNILLNEEGRPHVTDFGLAKNVACDSSLTQSGQLVGTPSYMAPEQASATKEPLTTAADVYGLGAILYALLTGRPPFRADTVLETLRQVKECEPQQPRSINPRVDRDLETICLKCLRKEPDQRYASAAALAEDLERWQKGEPIEARPLGRAARLRRWCRRNPLVASLIGTATVLIALVVGGLAVGLAVIWQQEQQTQAALDAVRQAKNDAEAREAETSAVLKFVEDKVFAAARPEGPLGTKATLRQAVEAALPFVEKSFTDQPLIEARLRMTLGDAFLDLGDAKVAVDQLKAARALYAKHRGPAHLDTLRCMNMLALSYGGLGQYTAAAELHEETLRLMKAHLGPNHKNTLGCMTNLAESYRRLGRYAEALELNLQNLALMKAEHGRNHVDTLGSMYNLAITYSTLGRKEEALNLFTEMLTLAKATLGVDHPHTFKIMAGLAVTYDILGRHEEAAKLNQQTMALMEAKLGPDHPDTLVSMSNLAISYAQLGRHADALKLNEKTLTLAKAKLSPDHPEVLACMYNLASIYNNTGRGADALELRKETLALAKARLGADHPKTFDCVRILADSYSQLGRHNEALKLLEESLPVMKAKLGPDHPDTLGNMWTLTQCLAKASRGAEAVPLIDDLVKRAAGQAVHPHMIPTAMDVRLRHFESTKNAAGCRETAELWEGLKRIAARDLYDAACMRAVTAAVLRAADPSPQATQEAVAQEDLAMARLTQAIAAGFKDTELLKKDNDLDILRARPDFKELLQGLAQMLPSPNRTNHNQPRPLSLAPSSYMPFAQAENNSGLFSDALALRVTVQ